MRLTAGVNRGIKFRDLILFLIPLQELSAICINKVIAIHIEYVCSF